MTENNPAPSSLSPPFPNLTNVITTDDVSQKGTGSYRADYVNWCRVSKLLLDNAPGWQFHLAHYVDSSHVWKAPNGTGYVVGYFTGPNGERTPDFPQAIMDHKNKPVAYESVNARDVTDTHRRALAACAAFTFGLAWQLWAKEEVENPMRESAPVESKPAAKIKGIDEGDQPLKPDDVMICLGEIQSYSKMQDCIKDFRAAFNLPSTAKLNETFTKVKHQQWLNANASKYV
jgi:hypothetical protein|tara:strand:+ start:136 stop:828 length:693 start_codon:yes stop_codon:yes gene_type:complete